MFLTFAFAKNWYLCSISPRSHLSAAGTFFGSVTTDISMCGRLLNIFSSTTLGSTRMRRTSLGLFEYRRDVMIEFMQTDLPDPVAPAISRWGIFARSETSGLPDTSRPSAIGSSAFASTQSSLSSSSRIPTGVGCMFGTSTPTAAFPGMGASMRTDCARIPRAMFLSRPAIFSTRTPAAGTTSYRVITGPTWISPIFTSTPNSLRIRSSVAALCWCSSSVLPAGGFGCSLSRLSGGNS